MPYFPAVLLQCLMSQCIEAAVLIHHEHIISVCPVQPCKELGQVEPGGGQKDPGPACVSIHKHSELVSVQQHVVHTDVQERVVWHQLLHGRKLGLRGSHFLACGAS